MFCKKLFKFFSYNYPLALFMFLICGQRQQTSVKVSSLYNPELIVQYESWLYMKEYDDPLVPKKLSIRNSGTRMVF